VHISRAIRVYALLSFKELPERLCMQVTLNKSFSHSMIEWSYNENNLCL